MSKLTKIAILLDDDCRFTFEIAEMQRVLTNHGVASLICYDSESILNYKPDCVLSTSPQHAKLTPFPTYGLLDKPRDEYLQIPRFLRNLLTYDGYCTFSPRLRQMIGDITFGARKLDTGVCAFAFYPGATTYQAPILRAEQNVFIFEPDFEHSHFKKCIYYLLEQISELQVITFSAIENTKHADRFIQVTNIADLEKVLSSFTVGICLNSGDSQEGLMYASVLKLISSSIITITQQSSYLQQYFTDSLYYIPEKTPLTKLPHVITTLLTNITENWPTASEKCAQAHTIFLQHFAFDKIFTDFQLFHAKTLLAKGYVPNPDPAVEAALPAVTYIMRTAGKHRPFLERALDCLAAQQYPDLRVLFVVHAPFTYVEEIKAKYPTLKIKVVESFKSQRSQAIRDGMEAVETELFGLFDDDDELFPNHVRSLVKTLQYHNKRDWRGEIGMVYSGSIHVDDTYPVFERVEFHDHKLVHKNEKRAIEHFKFYSSLLMSQHRWFMPNGWLARSALIDEELLADPGLDTCEDLYFELQLAQRRHYAFSVEVTAVHHFHHLGNSTIDDSHKHLPDTQRIALRNFSRVFPPDALYDTVYNIIGKKSAHDVNQIQYQDTRHTDEKEYIDNAFYPFRVNAQQGVIADRSLLDRHQQLHIKLLFLPFNMIRCTYGYLTFDKYKKDYYRNKFKVLVAQQGYITAIKRVLIFFAKYNPKQAAARSIKTASASYSLRELYFKARLIIRYQGWGKFFKLSMKKIFANVAR